MKVVSVLSVLTACLVSLWLISEDWEGERSNKGIICSLFISIIVSFVCGSASILYQDVILKLFLTVFVYHMSKKLAAVMTIRDETTRYRYEQGYFSPYTYHTSLS